MSLSRLIENLAMLLAALVLLGYFACCTPAHADTLPALLAREVIDLDHERDRLRTERDNLVRHLDETQAQIADKDRELEANKAKVEQVDKLRGMITRP